MPEETNKHGLNIKHQYSVVNST